MKKNKGFTLIEIIAVITILAILLLTVVPKVQETINKKKLSLYSSMVESIESAAKSYIYMNINDINNDIENDGVSYVTLSTLIDNKLIKDELINPIDKTTIPSTNKVKIEKVNEKYIIDYIDDNE